MFWSGIAARSSMKALDAYLELYHWQVEAIRRGLAEAESGAKDTRHEEVFEQLRAKIERRLASEQ